MGRRDPPHEGAHQCRDAGRCAHGALLRRRGHRALPHRAHVLRRRPHRRHARDDPGRHREGPARGARQAAADAALGFPRAVRDHGRPAGDDPPARPAAARIPAEDRRGDRRGRRGDEGRRPDKLRQRTEALHEFNPMLGHRGCRLAVSYPEIAEMQARAIFEAAVEAGEEDRQRRSCRRSWCRWSACKTELDFVKARIDAVAEGGDGGDRHRGRLSRRHDDRAAARRASAPMSSPRRPSSSPSAPTT